MCARFLMALLLAACGSAEPPSSSSSTSSGLAERPDEVASTRASREAASEAAADEPPADDPAVSPAPRGASPRPARPLVRLVPVAVAEAEDGMGSLVAAPRPVAFDLDARRFPPRALDPVLLVGSLRFTQYSHPEPGVLRFVAADRGALPTDAEIAVAYEGDERSRVVVASSLNSLGDVP